MHDALFQAYTLQNQYGIPHSEVRAYMRILQLKLIREAYG